MSNRRMTAQDAAERIFDVWVEANGQGMSQNDTLVATGLTAKQFKRGKEWLRDELCDDREQPFTYDPRTNTYHLNKDFEPVEEYVLYRLKVAAKQMKRLIAGTVAPANEKFGRRLKAVHKQLDRIQEDITDILVEL